MTADRVPTFAQYLKVGECYYFHFTVEATGAEAKELAKTS